MDTEHYYDLVDLSNSIDAMIVKIADEYKCDLVNKITNEKYKGFVLGRSPEGKTVTICDLSFQKSRTDGKYQPRLIFRRTDPDFNTVAAPASSRHRRIPFLEGGDGYRQFWTMIGFLYKFKEIIDLGEFGERFQVYSQDQLTGYLNNKSNRSKIPAIAQELEVDVSELIRTASTLKLLKSYKEKLAEFIENKASETDVQNWLDEDNHKYRQQRCMIFGLEYIDFRREGSLNSKNFDVLTRVGSKYIDHVLIELKSPSDDIFEITSRKTINYTTNEYHLHKELARAIPQILEYKSSLEGKNASDPELEKLGIFETPKIAKCVIVIGQHKIDARWRKNRENLVRSLNSSLEIWTYTELLNKLDSTIKNLELIRSNENQ